MSLIVLSILVIGEFSIWNTMVQRQDRPERSAYVLCRISSWMTVCMIAYVMFQVPFDPFPILRVDYACYFGAFNTAIAFLVFVAENSSFKPNRRVVAD